MCVLPAILCGHSGEGNDNTAPVAGVDKMWTDDWSHPASTRCREEIRSQVTCCPG